MSVPYSEEWYFMELRRGAYYTAAGTIMDALSYLLGCHSGLDPQTGCRLSSDADTAETMKFLTWITGDTDGTKVTRWLLMLSADPQSHEVLAEVVAYTRHDFKKLAGMVE